MVTSGQLTSTRWSSKKRSLLALAAALMAMLAAHGCAWGPGAPFCDYDGGDGGCVGGLDAGAADGG